MTNKTLSLFDHFEYRWTRSEIFVEYLIIINEIWIKVT
jgi:hypothetical protein